MSTGVHARSIPHDAWRHAQSLRWCNQHWLHPLHGLAHARGETGQAVTIGQQLQ